MTAPDASPPPGAPEIADRPNLSPSSSPTEKHPVAARIFLNPQGLRSGWRLLIFVVIWGCLITVGVFAYPGFAHPVKPPLPPGTMLFHELLLLVSLFAAAAIMGAFEKRSFADYLLPWRSGFRSGFWRGVIWGGVALSALLGVLRLGHSFYFGRLALGGTGLARETALWALVFIVVGLTEEFAFRGYALYTLTTGMGFWPAAIVLSAVFGATHLGNPGEAWVGALSAGLIGLFFCFTVRRTGTLWFAVGLHAMWDYAETFIYSVPNSGLVAKGHLLSSSLKGPRWLSGGTVGPEGSIFVFVTIAILFLLFHLFYPRAHFGNSKR
jgi:uncharacterized protein